MSYILDALKKAESERALGSIPSIYAAPLPVAPASSSGRAKWLPWILALNALAITVIGALWFNSRPMHAAATAATPATPVTRADAPTFATPAISPASARRPDAGPALRPAAASTATSQTGEKSGSPAPVQAVAVAAEPPVGSLRDLPENVQREVPVTTVNGYIYARNAADRSVLINNKLLHEGEQVEPGLVLEKLTPNGAVLNFKGYQYRVPY